MLRILARFRISLRLAAVVCLAWVASTSSSRAAGETVAINTVFGGDVDDWVFSNSSGTATNGYTVRIGAFSQNQSEVLSLSYNRAWISNQMQPFGSNVTATEGASVTAGSFIYTFENSDDFFKGKQAWIVYSDNSALTSSSNFGIVSSSNGSYTIAAANPWTTTLDGEKLQTSLGGVVGFGNVTVTNSTTGTIRVAAAPTTALYWDSNGAGGLGGTGTWSSSISDTEWTTLSDGESADGPYAWGTSDGSNFSAGAGLTAHFGGTAGTVTVSGTVQAHNGLTFASDAYDLITGTINLAGGSAAANTITVSTSGHDAIISAALTGSTGMTKAGDGTLTLNGTNTYTGSTTINAGTLQANAANALGSTSSITVNNGGSLLISATNAVNNSAAIDLDSGTSTPGMSFDGNVVQALGTLTLSENSIIDMGGGDISISFDALTALLTGSTQLNIWNYTLGSDHIYFDNTTNIGNAQSLQNVNFFSGSNWSGFLGNGFIGGTELYAAVVPEPEVYATAVLLLLGLGIHLYRRRRAQALPVAA